MSEESFRGFIAIPSPSALRQRVEKMQAELRKLSLDVKWVLPEQLHLTAKFLGETPASILNELKETLNRIAQEFHAFSFSVDRLGAFPNLRRPRVLWVGGPETPPAAQPLIQSLEEVVSRFGFPKENRPFKAHLTLGRFRSPKGCEKLEKWILENPLSWREEFPCDRLILFQSTLTSQGPLYAPLHEVSLTKI